MSGPLVPRDLTEFLGGSLVHPSMTVEATIDFGHNTKATICKLEIELLREEHVRQGDSEELYQDFALRLSVERGDGTVGLHQRSLSGFEWHKYNAVWLIAHAFAQFDDVTEKEPFSG